MKSKNILAALIILVLAYLAYSFYKKTKTPLIKQDNLKTAMINKNSKPTADNSKNITKDEIKDIIKEEIKDNPEIVISAIESYLNKQQNTHNKKMQQSVIDFKDQLLNNRNDPKYGNPNAKNSIVTFYDYNCGYCKKMSEVIKQIVDNKQDVYIVFKELPILNADSLKASKLALGVYQIAPEKYLNFHFKLMNDNTNASLNQKVKAICQTLNIDSVLLYKKIEDPTIQFILDQNLEIAKGIGFRSTPTVIINNKLIPDFINYDKIMNLMNNNDTLERNKNNDISQSNNKDNNSDQALPIKSQD